MALLQQIKSPDDIKRMDEARLNELAGEIRDFLVQKTALSGGHLASNLGVVELTIALHRVFESPKDKLIFDVGHQCYVHKMFTGRQAGFDGFRGAEGLSGFPKTTESEHDAFNTGHSATSISAALGMLRAKRLTGEPGCVAAIVGDGALTGGMCFEGLNDAGQSELPLIVILNDNEMSISRNVGALNRHLNKLRVSPGYLDLKESTQRFLRKLPLVGACLERAISRFKTRIKYFLLPNALFEELGFTYLGPIDGHNIKQMIQVLNRAKNANKPVLVHIRTKKGYGYPPAERHPERFHSTGPFDAATGNALSAEAASNSSIFGEKLCELAGEDARIVAITAAMRDGTGLSGFAQTFPNRFFDAGIAEQHAVTMAAGMAAAGLKPVVAVYSTFLQRAYDQLLHDVCLQNLPVVFALDRAGLVGEDGETHHGIYDIGYLLTMPNMMLLSPATREELEEMLAFALKAKQPVAIRYNKGVLPRRVSKTPVLPLQWEALKPIRPVTVVATGRFVARMEEVCRDIDVGLVNAKALNPMDADLILTLNQSARCVITVEDGIRESGFGVRLRALLNSGIRVINLGVPVSAIVSHASIRRQDMICGLDSETLLNRIKQEVER